MSLLVGCRKWGAKPDSSKLVAWQLCCTTVHSVVAWGGCWCCQCKVTTEGAGCAPPGQILTYKYSEPEWHVCLQNTVPEIPHVIWPWCFMQALERRTMWQWLCASHAQVTRNILMYGGQVKQSEKRFRTISTGVLRLLNPVGSVNISWVHDRDVLEVLMLKDYEAKRLLKSIINIRYDRRY